VYITTIVHNDGELNVPLIPVDFYYMLDNGSVIWIQNQTIDTAAMKNLEYMPPEAMKGDAYMTQITWVATPSEYGIQGIQVVVDLNNTIDEIHEDNNVAFKAMNINIVPDLKISTSDIFFSDPTPNEGQEITIFSMIHNTEDIVTNNFHVQIYYDNPSNMIAEEIIYIEENGTQTILSSWNPVAGEHTIFIEVDSYNIIEELNESNNFASKDVYVNPTANNPPVMQNIPTIYMDIDAQPYQFDLDDYVTDSDNTINQLLWSVYGNMNLSVNINLNHIASISVISGSDVVEAITFKVEDPSGGFDEKTVIVNASNFTDIDGDSFFMEVNDCDDTKALVHPFMPENCATRYDDNCDERINEGCKIIERYYPMQAVDERDLR